ncbi:winged helix-turn-helix transcriptional regulator [Rosenbergiella epipactidis]|uniref:winged helix-turn-helix transcriptional regulator n=1 Tax=Rosenbergiella epipactidis TaxID=1544694 RepID=UPI003F6B7CE7
MGRLSTREITSRCGSNDGLVSRTVYAEVPPRVEYAITEKARGLGPIMEALTSWWLKYGETLPTRPTTRGRNTTKK